MGGKTSALRQKSQCDTRKSVLQRVKKSNVCLQGTQRRLAEKKVKSESGISVLNCMGHHSRTKAFSQMCQNSEEHPKDSNCNHHARTLIAVGKTEECSGADDADDRAARHGSELALEVSAKNDLLEQASEYAQENEETSFQFTSRNKRSEHAFGVLHLLGHVVKVQRAQCHARSDEHKRGNDQESNCNADVEQEVFRGLPPSANQLFHRNTRAADPEPYEEDQE